ALVLDLGDGARHVEPVRESRRDVALTEVVRRKDYRHPLPEGRRPAPDVDRHIEDFAREDANELALRVTQLQMQTAQRPADRLRVIVLHERRGDAELAIPIRAVRFDEEAAAVAVHVRLDDEHVGDDGSLDAHDQSSCSRTWNRYWPYALDAIARASRSRSARVM